jgi:hypothetical protein
MISTVKLSEFLHLSHLEEPMDMKKFLYWEKNVKGQLSPGQSTAKAPRKISSAKHRGGPKANIVGPETQPTGMTKKQGKQRERPPKSPTASTGSGASTPGHSSFLNVSPAASESGPSFTHHADKGKQKEIPPPPSPHLPQAHKG